MIDLIAAVDFLRSAELSKSLVMLLVQSAPESTVVSKVFQGHNQALILAAELSKDPWFQCLYLIFVHFRHHLHIYYISFQYSITIALRADLDRNFRQIFQFKHIDACDLLSNPDKYPQLKTGIEGFDKMMPGIIQKCPYKVA